MKKLVALLMTVLLLNVFAGCSQADEIPDDPNQYVYSYDDSSAGDAAENTFDWSALIDEKLDMSVLSLDAKIESADLFSNDFAKQLLVLSSAQTADDFSEMFTAAGFTVVKQGNFDKADDDISHTCAYTLAKRTIAIGGVNRMLYVIAVRGTYGGEWYSNFDFAPSHTDNGAFAENFLFAAEDVLIGIKDYVDISENPFIVATGYSRGAACANILSLLLDSIYGGASVSGYSFATPPTYRDGIEKEYKNIFVINNKADLVPYLPLRQWGYRSVGTEIWLDADPDGVEKAGETAEMLYSVAPSVISYYNDRHSLTTSGLSDEGITAYELMLTVCAAARNGNFGFGNSTGKADIISDASDFAPLAEQFSEWSKNGGSGFGEIVKQHMPTTYQKLLNGR